MDNPKSQDKNDTIKENNNSKKKVTKDEKLEELKHSKNKTFFTALGHAIDGVVRAFKTERNLRFDYLIGLFILIGSLFFDFTKTEFACLCLTIGFVLFAEMVNSTVEYIVDLVTDKYDDRAKAAKDIAAGGVLIAAGVAVVVAYFLFVDKIGNATTAVLNSIISSKLHILMTIVFAVVLLAVILKGLFGKGDKVSQSYPSARVALSFALTTYVYIITSNLLSTAVAFVLSIIIAQIKVEKTKGHPLYIVLSAVMGILVVLIVYQLVLAGPDITNVINSIINR